MDTTSYILGLNKGEKITEAVTEWLDENVDPVGSAVIVDESLTIEGAAADAKKTGDEISSLKSDLTTAQHDISGLKGALGFFSIDGTNPEILDHIHQIVQAGEAQVEFGIGEQISLAYKNGTTDYILPWDIVAFGNFELEGGTVKPGMVIQSHYAMQAVQFSASQAIMKCASALAPGTYHFTIGTSWGTHCVKDKVYQFTTTVEVPADGQIVIGSNTSFYTWGAPDVNPTNWRVYTFSDASSTTPLETLTLTEGSGGTDIGTLSSSTKFGASGLTNLQMAAYGYNRWSHSANRQFYNSAAAAGAWWTPQHDCDRPPQQLASVQGFMKGFDAAFLDIIAPVKVTTALNTVSDSDIGASENTYDTFFLPSLEQEYIVPQASGVEGDYFPYWKERLGLSSPQPTGTAGANSRHIRYGFDAKSTAQYCRVRSAYRGSAFNTWIVYPTGYASYYSAARASRGCPACVII